MRIEHKKDEGLQICRCRCDACNTWSIVHQGYNETIPSRERAKLVAKDPSERLLFVRSVRSDAAARGCQEACAAAFDASL